MRVIVKIKCINTFKLVSSVTATEHSIHVIYYYSYYYDMKILEITRQILTNYYELHNISRPKYFIKL